MSPFAFRITLGRFVIHIFPVVEKVFRRLKDFTDAAFEFAHRRNGFLVWCCLSPSFESTSFQRLLEIGQ